jgi:hypothetical protein
VGAVLLGVGDEGRGSSKWLKTNGMAAATATPPSIQGSTVARRVGVKRASRAIS